MRKRYPGKKSVKDEMATLARERTILSRERTILSFIQTGLAFIGIGIIIVNFMIAHFAQVIGWALILIGFVGVLESYKRLRAERREMEKIKEV